MKDPIYPDTFYHIYNRGNNKETIFKEERNYFYFLSLWSKYISPVADTYCYCLLSNHFHCLIKIKPEAQLNEIEPYKKKQSLFLSKTFSNLFNAYTKTVNKAIDRTGSLFEENFKKKKIESLEYCKDLVLYIHTNAEKHHLTDNCKKHPNNSYHSFLAGNPTKLMREKVLEWFGGERNFIEAHEQYAIDKSWWKHIFEQENDDD